MNRNTSRTGGQRTQSARTDYSRNIESRDTVDVVIIREHSATQNLTVPPVQDKHNKRVQTSRLYTNVSYKLLNK